MTDFVTIKHKYAISCHPDMSDSVQEWIQQRDLNSLKFGLLNKERNMPELSGFTDINYAYRMANKLSRIWGDIIVFAEDQGGKKTHLIGKDERVSVKKHQFIQRDGRHLDIRLASQLMELDTDNWVYEGLTASFSSKDADLDDHYTGVRVGNIVYIPEIHDWVIECEAFWAATFPPPYIAEEVLTEKEYDQMMDIMAESIEPIDGGECEWTGDDWFASGSIRFDLGLSSPQTLASNIQKMTWSTLEGVSKQLEETRKAHERAVNDSINFCNNKDNE